MSNHIHLLARAGSSNLSNILRDFKRHTSKRIIDAVQMKGESRRSWLLMIFRYAARKHNRNNNYQVWTHENRAIEIFSNKFIEQKIDYIHKNPVVSGIVANAEDYMYSSARNYADLESKIDIIQVSRRWKTY